MKNYTKLDDNTLQINEEVVLQSMSTYLYADLVVMKNKLAMDKVEYCAAKDKEIANIEEMILQADLLGIK